jgi:hypothetical protein
MFGKRLAVGLLVGSLGLAAFGGLSNSSGQLAQTAQTEAPGVSYGGVRDFDEVWLRLDASRNVILSFELPWAASGKRCSDKKAYTSTLFTGAEYQQAIAIRRDGTFARTVVDRYRFEGTGYVETQIVKGTLTDAKVSGTIEGKSVRTKSNGRVVRCTFGPLRWSGVN